MLKPLGGRVLVEPDEAEEKTKGGIILPDTAKKKPHKGRVAAVGPGCLLENGKRAPMEVEVGDVVVYSKYAGTEITMKNGKKYVILEDDAVLAVDQRPVSARNASTAA